MSQFALIPTPGRSAQAATKVLPTPPTPPAPPAPPAPRHATDEAPRSFRDTLAEADSAPPVESRDSADATQPDGPADAKESARQKNVDKTTEKQEPATSQANDAAAGEAEAVDIEAVETAGLETVGSNEASAAVFAAPPEIVFSLPSPEALAAALPEASELVEAVLESGVVAAEAGNLGLGLVGASAGLSAAAEPSVQAAAPVVANAAASVWRPVVAPLTETASLTTAVPTAAVLAVDASLPTHSDAQGQPQGNAGGSLAGQAAFADLSNILTPVSSLPNVAGAPETANPLLLGASASPGGNATASAALTPTLSVDAGGDTDAINAARLMRGLNSAVNQQGGQITLRLTPPDVGTVRIQLQLQGTTVSAQFHAATESARTLLTQQLSQLRSTLEAQGLQVDKLSVQVMSPNNSSGLQQQSSDSQQQANADGRSRGQYFGQSSQGGDQPQDGSPAEDADAPMDFAQRLDQDAD